MRKWASASTVHKLKNRFQIFVTVFGNHDFDIRSQISATTLTQRPPYWSCSEETPPVGGPIFWQSHRSPMPLSNFAPVGGAVVRVAGPLLEPPVPPLVQLRAVPGPWCGASVGTTGSAPCAGASRQTCPPKNVRSNRNFTSVYAKKYDFGRERMPTSPQGTVFLMQKTLAKTFKNIEISHSYSLKRNNSAYDFD